MIVYELAVPQWDWKNSQLYLENEQQDNLTKN